LKIEGRKFSGGRNPTDKGSGAIDLVIALTGRNFKEAVEFLLTRYSIDTLVSDSANQFIAEKQQAIVALDPKPRILTLKDVPPVIWKPAPGKWPQIFQRLVNNYHADEKYLSMLNEKGHVWATANSLLAFNRTDWGATNQERLGVTLLDLSQSELTPRILIPEQGGAFCVGRLWDKTNNVVAVANPLEALSYRSIFKMGNPAGTSLPMILSLDADLPTPELFEKIRKAKKNLTIATNRYFHIDDISQKFPQLIKPDGECVDWFGGFEYAKEKTLTKNPSRAWTLRLADAIIQQQVYQK